MMNGLKDKILRNTFVDQVRMNMKIDELEYEILRGHLIELAASMKGSKDIDRELMLTLFAMPTMIRNASGSFAGREPRPEIALRLEDIWIELDELITDCLAD